MPKRTDLQRILLLGSGPIVIGQAAEFDYSGTQAVKALKEEGYRVILVNSNPATIMTDPELADRTYIEPVTPDWVRKVIERERPDALLPTMGGQTALNVAMALARDGTLERYGVELIGANARAIQMAEDRAEFAAAMGRIGLATPVGRTVGRLADALAAVGQIGYPAVIRPSYTLGGTGGGVAFNRAEFEEHVDRAHRDEARRRLHPRRAAERHHADHPGVVRAGARLRGRQGAALRVREVPDRRLPAHDADEVRGRGDGDRAHVQGGVPEGTARARDRPPGMGRGRHAGRRPPDERLPRRSACGAARPDPRADVPDQARPRRRAYGGGYRPGVAHRPVVPLSDGGPAPGGAVVRGTRGDRGRGAAPDEAHGVQRSAARRAARHHRGGGPGATLAAGRASGLQD